MRKYRWKKTGERDAIVTWPLKRFLMFDLYLKFVLTQYLWVTASKIHLFYSQNTPVVA